MTKKLDIFSTVSTYCDLCGSSAITTPLYDQYATKDIKFLCSACESLANTHLNKVRALSSKWNERILKLFLAKKKDELCKHEGEG